MTDHDNREFLMIPGPVSVDDEVLEALGQSVRAHYGDGGPSSTSGSSPA